ncbi:MAG TPA: hypothetical protein PKN45_00260 [Candidatus Limiplasma sp.]|mgnify:CR=1 FL=1|nr:hypothetical protein [Candidatus Limiplasma sp.]HPR77716.1 hypothetical protein [Candidatus Limiplasma sp.]
MKPAESRIPAPAPQWQSRPHRFWYRFCAVCLALYLAYASYLSRSGLFRSAWETMAALLWFVMIAAGLYMALVWFAERASWRLTAPEARGRLQPRLFAAVSGGSFAILCVFLAAANPGGVTVDSAVQWTQALTGVYSNWHPVFHTLLLHLCTLIAPSYTLALALQCLAFSVALGYLAATLSAWGVKAVWLLPVIALTVLSPIVGNTLMFLWKDNAMTVGVLVLGTHAVNLYYTRGAWLRRPRNAVAFGLALAFTTLVRHNAILFTLPLLVTAALTCAAQRKGALTAVAVMVVSLALVWGPLYSSLKVTYPQNTLEESIGVPMTVVCDIRSQNPDALSPETRAFTDAMADENGWNTYLLHNYNSIKFGATRGLIAHATLAQVLRMAADAAKADPANAFASVNGLTDLVWGLADEGAANVQIKNSGDLPDVPRQNGRINRVGSAVKTLITAPLQLNLPAWYYGNIGVSFALLLVFSLRALRRNGVRALLLCVPTLLYNLGTLCVLCGPDARFFAFSPLLSTLTLFALARDPAPETLTAGEEQPA